MNDIQRGDRLVNQPSPISDRKQSARTERKDRLANELRANLRKRKDQVRLRDNSHETTSESGTNASTK